MLPNWALLRWQARYGGPFYFLRAEWRHFVMMDVAYGHFMGGEFAAHS
jgi:hypothetical protein